MAHLHDNPEGLNGNLATTLPSNKELRSPKTMKRTSATTAPDLNLMRERSRLDSLRLISTRSIFLVLDFFLLILTFVAEEEDKEFGVSVFMVSSFLVALSIEERRDLQELVWQMRSPQMFLCFVLIQGNDVSLNFFFFRIF